MIQTSSNFMGNIKRKIYSPRYKIVRTESSFDPDTATNVISYDIVSRKASDIEPVTTVRYKTHYNFKGPDFYARFDCSLMIGNQELFCTDKNDISDIWVPLAKACIIRNNFYKPLSLIADSGFLHKIVKTNCKV